MTRSMALYAALVTAPLLLLACPRAAQEKHDEHEGHGHEADEHDEHADEHDEHADEHEGRDEHADEHEGHAEEADEHEGHGHEGHAHAEVDFDADALARLIKVSCEHAVPILECDECRYEVGAVDLAPGLLDAKADNLIRTAKVSRAEAKKSLALTGEVGFDEGKLAHISPRISGTARRVLVALGDRVKAGDRLVEIDSLELGRLRSQYVQTRARLARAEQDFTREERLHAKKITAESERLKAQTALAEARADLQAAESQLELLGYDVKARQQLLKEGTSASAGGRLVLRAPLTGTIVTKHVVPGEQVAPEHEIFTVADLATVWIWASVYERDLAAVIAAERAGPVSATVVVAGFPDSSFEGRLDYVGATMDEATRTVKVRINVDNAEGMLRPGMFAEVKVDLEGGPRVVHVPTDAVVSDEGTHFVFVRAGPTRFMRRDVQVGATRGAVVEVRSGLREGEEIVARGAFLLKSDILREKMGAGCAD